MRDLRLTKRLVMIAVTAATSVVVAPAAPANAAADSTTGVPPSLSLLVQPGMVCPDAASLERELSAVVTMRFAASGATPAAGAFSLSVARAEQGAGMVLRDPDGATVMARTVAVFPTRCEIAAQAIAIIVERYFRDLVTAADVPPAPAIAQPANANVPPAPAGPVAAQALVRAEPSAPVSYTSLPRWTVGAGPAYWTRLTNVRAQVDAHVRLGRVMVVSVGTLFPWFTSQRALNASSGQASLVGMPVIATIGAGIRRGRLGGSVGLQGLVTFEKGETTGIAATDSAWRAVLATGPVLGAGVDLGSNLRIAADASLNRAVLGRSYQVGGVAGAVLDPPSWQAVFGVRLEWSVFP